MSTDIAFTKENLDLYLSKLAKEYRKLNGKNSKAELVLIGGAAVLANYGFREMTYDVDAIIRASSAMKQAANTVGDELGLPNGWLNSDFMKTTSFSPKLLQYSEYYKTFGYVLDVRIVSREYLVAMKLMSGRQYKNDISDVVGILREEQLRGTPLTLDKIKNASINLYGSWEAIPEISRKLITAVLQDGRLEMLFEQYKANEKVAKSELVKFEQKYPGVTTQDNVNDIISSLRKRKTR